VSKRTWESTFCLFACGLFNDTFSSQDIQHRMVGSLMNNELKITWKEAVVAIIKVAYHTCIFLEGLKNPRNTSITIACFRAKIWTRGIPNKKQVKIILKALEIRNLQFY
jgi:hypothetical protein